ncbi:DUF6058 family natural product biosynthesis protein [Tenggerimyces flavus]|uniref:DUF6058 family natural product biosynthesis protein n=1 Tax=Tenggerimyces flavus TaxID=1708749 RepID=A0ABV7Y896_9ACTN|nr:DUF6058 family natural product biosynthesis protein [Tenggerimyces flavus]MBM7791257.1 hypothetical protein [Tenggerimyces flavus]
MTLREQVLARYVEVNGSHPMTPEDDAYVSTYFSTVESVVSGRSLTADDVRSSMLAGLVPLPSYLRSDGTEMVHADLLSLGDTAGGLSLLPDWFRAQFDDEAVGKEEWSSYLSGQYVCLWTVSPRTIQRKDVLTERISALLASPQAESAAWLASLHEAVDELDELEPPFTAYDRLRFGGPVSRDTMITAVRRDYPRPVDS